MARLIHTVALIAALVVLVASLWQDWGILVTAKRAVIAYLAFFFLGAVMALAVRMVTLFDKNPAAGENDDSAKEPEMAHEG